MSTSDLERALTAFDPKLFGVDPIERHMAASPFTVEAAQRPIREAMQRAITAYLSSLEPIADVTVEPVAWMHPTGTWAHKSRAEIAAHCHNGKGQPQPIPLYASPVVTPSYKAEGSIDEAEGVAVEPDVATFIAAVKLIEDAGWVVSMRPRDAAPAPTAGKTEDEPFAWHWWSFDARSKWPVWSLGKDKPANALFNAIPLYTKPQSPSTSGGDTASRKVASPVLEFFGENVDAWGAAQWFDRLAGAIREQDKAVVAGDDIRFETCRNVASSSAMRLVRDYEAEVRAALAAAPSSPTLVSEEVETK